MNIDFDNAAIAMIGHGSWATALVKILTDNGVRVNWYVRNSEVRESLEHNKRNPKYLTNIQFNTQTIKLHSDINHAVRESQVVILATPSAFLEGVLHELTVSLDGKFILSAVKGIIPNGYLTIAEYVNQAYGISFDHIGVVTGPCHAEEVALERLSYLTVVAKNLDTAARLGARFANRNIRVSTSTDIYGTEYAAVLKNIYAIAVGMSHSLRYGDNFMAVLIANASDEMSRFMKATYPSPRNTNDSAYLGDLLVTCYSQFSRNRAFGLMIGKGYSVKYAQMEMNMVAEGYYSAACIKKVLERYDTKIDMPIVEAVYGVLYQMKSARDQMDAILDHLV
ncbi:MAG: NAD(P)H-dependent glycerol-3-phosphate dehydrogenase [Rikenellaceae bacterium]